MLLQEVLGECKAIVFKEEANASCSSSQHVGKNKQTNKQKEQNNSLRSAVLNAMEHGCNFYEKHMYLIPI